MDPYLPYVASVFSGVAAAAGAIWVSRNSSQVTLTVSDRESFMQRQAAFEARMDAEMQRLRDDNARLADEVRRVTTENLALKAENAQHRVHIAALETEIKHLKEKLGRLDRR